ncbi:type II toxin-antitoxin system VapC family toxin [Xylanimonas sp. McL0601]|uniref:type II toxin-antitoxin system VapC family toxin n=1 Tax=Xylanimonas sp. McL0601 TaxID=3414739 RepID=UPI003CF491FE
MIAFDTDVLVHAADLHNPLGRRVAVLFDVDPEASPFVGTGSVLLLPEVLTTPLRTGDADEQLTLISYLGRIELVPVDAATAQLGLSLAVDYGLRAADAIHLATAVNGSADQFLTNNRKDFPKSIVEIDILYPDDLPEPPEGAETPDKPTEGA